MVVNIAILIVLLPRGLLYEPHLRFKKTQKITVQRLNLKADCEWIELSLCLMGDFLTTENLPLTSLVVLNHAKHHNEQTVNVAQY
jgi:hypothetical protein